MLETSKPLLHLPVVTAVADVVKVPLTFQAAQTIPLS
jgi:hypothetical protein